MKAFLIPGGGEDFDSRDYKGVLKAYKKCGYEPEFVSVDWKYRTINDWVKQLETKISKKDLENSLLSGFSFGSMIALNLAAKVNPKKLLLFSLSPYFKEDFPMEKKYEDWAGKRRIATFKELSFNELAIRVKCPTIIFLGSKEKAKYKDMWHRSSEANRLIKNSKFILVEGVGHDVDDPIYVEAIAKSFSSRV